MSHCRSCGGLLEMRSVVEHGRAESRQVCKVCGVIFYDNPIPVVMCLVEKAVDSRRCVLMTKNIDAPASMPLVFVAGFLEKTDQSPSFGMSRELEEELGLKVDESRLELLGVSLFHRMNQLTILYTVELKDSEEPVRNEKELSEIRWVPITKLKLSPVWKEGPAEQVRKWVAQKVAQSKL